MMTLVDRVTRMRATLICLGALLAVAATASGQFAHAQVDDAVITEDRVQVEDTENSIDGEFDFGIVDIEGDSSIGLEPIEPIDATAHIWMLSVTCLALLTALPGAALLVAGTVPLVDMPRVLATSAVVAAALALAWVAYGYTLAYGGTAGEEAYSPWYGNGEYVLLAAARPEFDESTGETRYPTHEGVSTLAHVMFRGVLFVLAGLLVMGAVVDRFSPLAVVVFTVGWATLVVCPLMHWTWDAGIFEHGSDHAQVAGINTGVVDSAGGLAVFVAVGVSGLVAMRGTRRSKKAVPSSSNGNEWGRSFVAFAGTWLFFVGMCGLVGRSNTAGHGQASAAVMNTILAAGAGCLGWCAVESLRQTIYRAWPPRSMDVQGRSATSAVVAGVATIASGAVYLDIPWVVCAAFVAGVCAALPGIRAGQPDSGARALLAAIAIGGSIGVVMTGIFATRDVAGPSLTGGRLGVLENGPLLSQHLAALIVVWIYAGLVSIVLAKLVQLMSSAPGTHASATE